jgi:hypothetical protein
MSWRRRDGSRSGTFRATEYTPGSHHIAKSARVERKKITDLHQAEISA